MKLSGMYSVQLGDTFESISRKQYGTETEALRISQANPGTSEPLSAGTVLSIPVLPGAPQDIPARAPVDGIDEVAVLIDGKRFRFWEGISVSRSMDQMDTVELAAPFDADAPGFRETFTPFSYNSWRNGTNFSDFAIIQF